MTVPCSSSRRSRVTPGRPPSTPAGKGATRAACFPDFATKADLSDPGGVGLLVFGSGRDWGAAYLGPDGHVRSYAVTEPGEAAEQDTATVPQAASSAQEAVLDPASAVAAPGPVVTAPRVRYARLQRGAQPAADEAKPAAVARDAAE